MDKFKDQSRVAGLLWIEISSMTSWPLLLSCRESQDSRGLKYWTAKERKKVMCRESQDSRG